MPLPTKSILYSHDLSVDFGGLKALNHVELRVRSNEIVGLIGPNGAGKTTLINCITGIQRRFKGSISFLDQNMVGKRPEELAQIGLARTFQHIHLFGELTVMENIMIGAHTWGRAGMWQYALKTSASRRERLSMEGRARDLAAMMGLTDQIGSRVASLPFAAQRRVDLARALACEPKLVLLDEPAAGLSRSETDELQSLLTNLVSETSLESVLLVEHDMDMVMAICDSILVLNYGEPLIQDAPDVIQVHPGVVEAYLGGSDSRVLP